MFAPDRLALLSQSPSARLFLVDELRQLRQQLEEKRHLYRVWAGDQAPALLALDELLRAVLAGLDEAGAASGGEREAEPIAATRQSRAESEEIRRAPRQVAARVLVVDDNPLVRRALGRVLALGGYAVTLLPSAEEALAQADAETPALALVDVQMEGLSGLELCLRLRDLPRWQRVPILLMSGAPGPQLAQEALEAGADDFLRKPLDPEDVLQHVRSLLSA